MSAFGAKLRSLGDGAMAFYCPGCNEAHVLFVVQAADGRPRPVWEFNNNGDAPTFKPSVLVTSGHHVPNFAERFPPGVTPSCWCTYNVENPDEPDPFHCQVCHSFVTDGRIQFLDDCTHALAGATVPLPDYPSHASEA